MKVCVILVFQHFRDRLNYPVITKETGILIRCFPNLVIRIFHQLDFRINRTVKSFVPCASESNRRLPSYNCVFILCRIKQEFADFCILAAFISKSFYRTFNNIRLFFGFQNLLCRRFMRITCPEKCGDV